MSYNLNRDFLIPEMRVIIRFELYGQTQMRLGIILRSRATTVLDAVLENTFYSFYAFLIMQ